MNGSSGKRQCRVGRIVSASRETFHGREVSEFENSYWRSPAKVDRQLSELTPDILSDEQFRLLADNIPTLCWIANGDGYIVWYNRRWHEYCGTTPEEMEGWGWQSVHDPELLPQVMDRWTTSIATGEAFEMTFPLRGGDGVFRPFLTRIQPVRDASGSIARWFGVNTDISGQADAEQALRESEQQLRAIFDATPECIMIVAPDGTLLQMNHAGICMVEASGAGAVEGTCVFDLIAEDNREEWRERHARVIAGERLNWEFDIVGLEGTRRRMETHAVPLPLEDGTNAQLAVTRDISERKSAEDAVRDSETRFRTVFENAAVGMLETDAQWRILGANSAYSQITGYSLDELVGMSSLAFTHPDDVATSEAALQRVARPGGQRATFEKRYVRKDGRIVWIRSNLSKVSGEGPGIRILKVIEDITDVREAREEVEEQSRILETLNRTGSAIASELDLQKVVQMVTDAGVELIGAQFGAFFYNVLDQDGASYMLYTLSGAEPSQFDFGMPRATAVFHPTFSGEGTVRSDDITKDPRYGKSEPHHGMPKGHLPVCSYLAVPVMGRSDEVLGGLFFGHPEPARFTESHEQLMQGLAAQAAISIDNARLYQAVQRANETLEQRVQERTVELETAHEALRQAQKMEAIGQLTGGIAHDFNNMLTVIRGSADVLRRPNLEQEKRQRYLEAIAETSERAARLTGQLLAFARRQALKPETFDVLQRVESIADMLRTVLGSRIRLNIAANCEDCFVKADAAQFETALVNMAVNARDAMNGEGELCIRIDRAERLPTSLQPQPAECYVAVGVSDTGQGIAGDDMSKIFEPFFTTKEIGKGTGLGLSQVYGFAKQSGGEIGVDSEVGKGSTFTLYLPEADKNDAAAADSNRAIPELSPGGRVLIVEDNEEVARFAEQVLAELGFEAIRTSNADEALRQIEDGSEFDMVFSDVVMPGMDGIEFARTLRSRRPGLPVVLTSGYSHVLAAQSEHEFPLLQKPYSLEGLQLALAEALRR